MNYKNIEIEYITLSEYHSLESQQPGFCSLHLGSVGGVRILSHFSGTLCQASGRTIITLKLVSYSNESRRLSL